jgi:hypothetical protein
LQSVIAFYWEALGSKSEVLARVLSLSLTTLSAPQWALAFCVLLGVVVSFFKREFLWLTFTYGLVALVFVLGCSSNGFLKHFLIGFWYTDPFRVAVMLSIAATPLAAIGMVGIYGLIEKLSRVVQPNRQTGCTVAMSALLVVMFFFANYCPSFAFGGSAEVKSSFGIFQDRIHSLTDAIYDEDEQDFVQQAKTFINDGDIVINDPYDGSAYLYGIEGVDVFYRRFHGYDYASETEYSHLLRENLADYASNSEVQDAVNETGAKWVLLLDAKDGELIQDDNLDTRWENWDPPRGAIENWLGLYEIKEETPGFELVLSDGDMRLYKILG